MPYTAFSARSSYMKEHPEVIQAFTDALQKGMDFVQAHTPEEIAETIAPQFPETDLSTITTIVTRYYEQDTWKADLVFAEESFELLQDILEDAGELTKRAPYEKLVDTSYAEKRRNRQDSLNAQSRKMIKGLRGKAAYLTGPLLFPAYIFYFSRHTWKM